jgi:hypothetical protein
MLISVAKSTALFLLVRDMTIIVVAKTIAPTPKILTSILVFKLFHSIKQKL